MEFAKLIQVEKEEKSDKANSLESQFTAEQAALAKIQAVHHHKDGSAVKLKVVEDDLSNSVNETSAKQISSHESQPHYGQNKAFSGKQSVSVGCSCGQVMHANFDKEGKTEVEYARSESEYDKGGSASIGYQSNETSDYVR